MEKVKYALFIVLIMATMSCINNNCFAQDDNPDLTFVRDAASGGLFEVSAGRLASAKSTNADVKAFAQKMIADHSKANQELKVLATQKSLALPDSMAPQYEEVYNQIAKLTGKAFDNAYIKEMTKAHDVDVSKFEAAIKNLNDSDLRAWAAKTLPVLKMHQKHVHDMQSRLVKVDK